MLCDENGNLSKAGFEAMLRRQLSIFSLRRAATSMLDSEPSQVSILALLKSMLILSLLKSILILSSLTATCLWPGLSSGSAQVDSDRGGGF